MIHRAVLGTLERFIGVLLEHTGGILPFWLAPEQVRVLSLSEKVEDYAAEVTGLIAKAGYRASADVRGEKARLQGARSGTGQNSLHGRGRRTRGSLPDGRATAPAR